jgi:UTP--glucose-1-phosphate uridylyltransferase
LDKNDLSPHLVAQLVSDGVDIDRMLRLLDDINSGAFDGVRGVECDSVPDADDPSIFDRRVRASWTMPLADAKARFNRLGLSLDPERLATRAGAAGSAGDASVGAGDVTFDESALETIGIHLYPKAAYGVLNGGSASSYADVKKNRSLDPTLFESHRERFDALAAECRGKPKGITPAYVNPDGTVGYSFLQLKLRMLLEHKKKYRDRVGPLPDVILPAFQMTSVYTDAAIQKAFRAYAMSDELRALAREIGCPSIEIFTESQSMMAAITPSSEGRPRRIFDRAYGRAETGLAMPGGHGQNFEILAPIYRKMYREGIRYVWLGNIDNMGYTVDPVSLAIFALSGKDAAFEESCRTPMDVKGGILVRDASGRLTVADIGPAIGAERMLAFEREGKPVLFNCGIGLFDLEKLIDLLPSLPARLPVRITDQDKDAGSYAQAEQITWEVIGLLDDPLFFEVDKKRRFIAAKMLMDTLLTSLPPHERAVATGKAGTTGEVSEELHRGLVSLLETEYGLTLENGRWVPRNSARS